MILTNGEIYTSYNEAANQTLLMLLLLLMLRVMLLLMLVVVPLMMHMPLLHELPLPRMPLLSMHEKSNKN